METNTVELEVMTWHDGFLRVAKAWTGYLATEKQVTRMYLLGLKHYLRLWIERIDKELDSGSICPRPLQDDGS